MNRKRKKNNLQKFLIFIIWLLISSIIIVLVWKFSGKFDIKYNSDFSRIVIKQPQASIDIYNIYKIKKQKINKYLYYVRINDIYCGAYRQSDLDIPRYFKINIVFETSSKENALAIENIATETVNEIRDMLKNYPAIGIDRAAVIAYLKRDLKLKMNNVLGNNVVVNIYFESFLNG